MNEDIEKLISRAKIGIMQKPESTFISTVCFSLKTIVSKTDSPTACTNGAYISYNPDFFLALNHEERVGLLAHETLHVAYMHMIRCGDKDPKVWNEACDYVINDHLIQAGFTLPKGGLYNAGFKDLSSDQVYKFLMENPQHQTPMDNGQLDLRDPTQSSGDPDEAQGTQSAKDAEQAEQEIREIVMRANLQVAITNGSPDQVPAEIQRMLEDLLKPKVDWRKALARFLISMSRSDYSTKKFNRKYLEDGLYFPTLVSEGNLSRIDFAVDVSGSVTPKICTQFCSEIHSVLQHHSPDEIGVMQFGTRVAKKSIVKGVKDLLTLEFVDGGGTLISPVFAEFEKSPAKALIILTDGFIWSGDDFKKPKGNRPIIWCIYGNPNFTCPFGKIIHFDL